MLTSRITFKNTALFSFLLLTFISLSHSAFAAESGEAMILDFGNWIITNLWTILQIVFSIVMLGIAVLSLTKWKNAQLALGAVVCAMIIALGPAAKEKIMGNNADAFIVESTE